MKVKKWLSGLAGVISIISGCSGEAMNKETTEFEWYAVATAPRDYPMEVINGTFFYQGQSQGVDIPSGGTLTQGWGVSTSVYLIGPKFKPLPDRVRLRFYSYAENRFFEGHFQLPYDEILKLFQYQLRQEPDRPYSSFLIGIAPGGAVSVWIKGPRTTEVFFGQANEIEMTPQAAFKLPFTSKEQSDKYVADALAESVTPEQLAEIKANGAPVGMWERYRNLYKWVPVYKDHKSPSKADMPVSFLNGEAYWLPTQFDEEMRNTPKPLPQTLKFRAGTESASVYYVIEFEPIELMGAFEKLGANGELVFIEFDPQIPAENIKIRVYNETESVELKKFNVE